MSVSSGTCECFEAKRSGAYGTAALKVRINACSWVNGDDGPASQSVESALECCKAQMDGHAAVVVERGWLRSIERLLQRDVGSQAAVLV